MMTGVMLDLYEEFRGVVRVLEDAEVPYAVCGGLALALYALPRATVDIDLLMLPENLEKAKALLKPLGFEDWSLSMNLEGKGGQVKIRRLTKLEAEGTDSLYVDFLLVEGHVLEEAWRTRARAPWTQGEISVVSREGLVALKRMRASGQDLLDIEVLQRGEWHP
jgi:hypothetical protein